MPDIARSKISEERVRLVSSRKTVRDVLKLRRTYRFEMQYPLQAAGLEILACCGDSHSGPPCYDKEQIRLTSRP